MSLKIEACQDQQHVLAFMVHQDFTARMKNKDSLLDNPTDVAKFHREVDMTTSKKEMESKVSEKHEFENLDESI